MNIPRSEHPKPQFQRNNWVNLNGEWDFCFDNGRSGIARKFYEDFPHLTKKSPYLSVLNPSFQV